MDRGEYAKLNNITHLIFDWGDTLMVDDATQIGAMAFWSEVFACDGVLELLPRLSAEYVCTVASNATDSDANLMRKALARVELAEYLTHFVTSKELGVKKPAPEFFVSAAQAIGALPENCVMIGNSYSSDVCGAKAAGMATVLITCEVGEYPLADYVIETFGDLARIML